MGCEGIGELDEMQVAPRANRPNSTHCPNAVSVQWVNPQRTEKTAQRFPLF